MRCWQACHASIRITVIGKKKFEPKICKNLQWCHYDKQLEQNKLIKEDQRLEHTNELETHIIRHKSNCIMNHKKQIGGQSCNHCGSYNFKNQKLAFGAQVHHLEDWRLWPW